MDKGEDAALKPALLTLLLGRLRAARLVVTGSKVYRTTQFPESSIVL